jgi:Rrf2 family protein
MLDIAANGTRGNIKIKDISRRQGISVKYLEQIITILNKAGYVRSERGPQGGYRLASKPDEITAGMIVRLMEGSASPAQYTEDGMSETPYSAVCITTVLWKRLSDSVNEVLDGTTLADMLKWVPGDRLTEVPDLPEYCI